MSITTDERLRILFVGTLGAVDTASHRLCAVRRLGHHVVPFDTYPYILDGGGLVMRLRLRTQLGPTVSRFNAAIIAAARAEACDLVWFEKPVLVRPATLEALRGAGIVTVQFNIDNPFGPRNDAGFGLWRRALPHYDLSLVQRDVNLADYRRAGARDVQIMRTAYEPSIHYPPPAGWSDADRINDVVYIGSPYDDRAAFLAALWERHGIRVRIWGTDRWNRVLSPDLRRELVQGTELWNDAYREMLWRSRICLSFVTHSNCDDVAHKSFEIAACGAFQLAEDTPGHRAHFVAGEEVVFFTSIDDCAAQIRRYLGDEAARARIAAAGRRRAEIGGYSYDRRIEGALRYLHDHVKAAAPNV